MCIHPLPLSDDVSPHLQLTSNWAPRHRYDDLTWSPTELPQSSPIRKYPFCNVNWIVISVKRCPKGPSLAPWRQIETATRHTSAADRFLSRSRACPMNTITIRVMQAR